MGALRAAIQAGLQELAGTGVAFVAMPCNTAHIYYDDLAASIDVPLLNMVDEALRAAPASAAQGRAAGHQADGRGRHLPGRRRAGRAGAGARRALAAARRPADRHDQNLARPAGRRRALARSAGRPGRRRGRYRSCWPAPTSTPCAAKTRAWPCSTRRSAWRRRRCGGGGEHGRLRTAEPIRTEEPPDISREGAKARSCIAIGIPKPFGSEQARG